MQQEIIEHENVDVLIAGGGVAGAAVAAALSRLGLSILIIEPGPSHGRRLAGELIHPSGIAGLCDLGLLDQPSDLGANVEGFAIFPFSSDEGPGPVLLPYSEAHGTQRHGVAIEHDVLKQHLLEKVSGFEGVRVWRGARVSGIEDDSDSLATATVQSESGETRIQARLIIGADGPMSQVRKMVGITHETQRYSGMMGVELDDTHLPNKGYGNIFLNPAGVSYAYAIGRGRARVMFEVLKGADYRESIQTHLSLFPPSFREDIENVIALSKPLAAPNFCIIPAKSVKNHVALVGDARGCCHPLTASGITAAVKDALILRDALRDTRLDFAAALRRYARIGNRLQLTRRTLAEELREAFLAQTEETTLLSQCIFSYWRTNPVGRVRSMALLSMRDTSIISLAGQYALVGLQAFRLLPKWFNRGAVLAWHRGVFRLIYKSFTFQQAAMRQWLSELNALAR